MIDQGANLPQGKQTVLGLYVTAKDAYEQWRAAPEEVTILDVRTPEEFVFVGYAPMAWRVPVATQSYEWDSAKRQIPMALLHDFVDRVRQVAEPDDTLMVMCRSGGRSAMAVNLLAQAGFKNVYNITDGMEGDLVACLTSWSDLCREQKRLSEAYDKASTALELARTLEQRDTRSIARALVSLAQVCKAQGDSNLAIRLVLQSVISYYHGNTHRLQGLFSY